MSHGWLDAEARVRTGRLARDRLVPRDALVGGRPLRAAGRRAFELRDGEGGAARPPAGGRRARRPPDPRRAGSRRRCRGVRARAACALRRRRRAEARLHAAGPRPRRPRRVAVPGPVDARRDRQPVCRRRRGRLEAVRPARLDDHARAVRRPADRVPRRRRRQGRGRGARVRARSGAEPRRARQHGPPDRRRADPPTRRGGREPPPGHGLRSQVAGVGYGPSPFPPIADYGFLSDCEATCLVAPSGNVEWMCLPRMDGPSVFASLLDRDAGGFRLGPADVMVPAGRRYLPGTNVLETTWMTRMGWLIVRDALSVGPWHDEDERSSTHRRAPTDDDAEHVLLRTVKCVQGTVELTLDCEPVFDYARRAATWEYKGEGYGDAVARAEGMDLELRLTTDMRVGFEGRRARARTTLQEGETAFAALSWSKHDPPFTYDEAFRRMERTSDFWREWLNHGSFPDHPWRIYLQRSALTLKGLAYAPTGAMVAASTTSLPETPHGERNWDYRYTWIRDATFTLWGLYTLGFDWEANDFFYYVADVAENDEKFQIMYGIGGEKELEEQELPHLMGYEN